MFSLFSPQMLSLFGTAMSVSGLLQQGRAEAKASKFNAQILEQNAVIALQNAAAEEERQRRFARRQLGSMRAAYGASGVTLEGSPLDVLADSAMEAELDALTIRYQGELRARGYTADASLDRARGANARYNSYLRAGSALLSGYGKYMALGD